MKPPYHIFRRNGKAYLLDVERLIAGKVSETAARALEKPPAREPTHLPPSVQAELENLELLGSVPEKPGKLPSPGKIKLPTDVPISSMVLLVTERCNLECRYCFGRPGTADMDEKTARRAVDWLIGQSRKASQLSICFFGGEPLLNFPLIERTVEYARKRGEETGKGFSFSITTNAILLDRARIAFFRKHDFAVLVSFDGPPEIQDQNRPRRGGGGSFRMTVPKIKRLLEAMERDRISCRATFCGQTEATAVYGALRELGFPTVDVRPVSPPIAAAGGKTRQLRKSEAYRRRFAAHFEEEAERFVRAVKTRDREALTPMQIFGKLVRRLIARKKIFFPCSAGREAVGISIDGSCYPCHRFFGLGEYRIGGIDSPGPARDEYLKAPMLSREPCSNCWASTICAGGCYHDNLALTGDRFTPDPTFCEDNRRLIETAIELYCGLDDSDRIWFMEETARLQRRSPAADGSFFALFQQTMGGLVK